MKLLVTLALLCAAFSHLWNDAEATPAAGRMPDASAQRCDTDDVTGAVDACNVSFEKPAIEVQS